MESLYHGTSYKNLNSILKNGIRPRGKRKGNWKEYPSRPDMVYLTNAYAPFFAIQSSKDKALILELDPAFLNQKSFYPDEDFIAQAIATQQNLSIEDVHCGIRENLEDYQHHAVDSLNGLGNICHKGTVPLSAISRYCVIDIKERADLVMSAIDPSISLMNYRFCGSRYRSIVSWIFGDRPDFEVGFGDNRAYIEMVEMTMPGYGEKVNNLFNNRKGIEVFVLDCQRKAI